MLDLLLNDFLVRAGLAALGMSLATGLLGCFVVWQRMAYFGDATAHAAILGVVVALALHTSILVGVAAVSVLMALSVYALAARGHAADTVLGVLSHGALAAGLVAVAFVPGPQVNLEAYLFGDVLLVTRTDLVVIWAGSAIVAGVIWANWRSLLTATLSPDLAYASGIDPRRAQLILTLLLAAVVAVSVKLVGALLITALLVIPAAAARGLTRTPEAMAGGAVAVGAVASVIGVFAAIQFDTKVGPTIVCVAVALFSLSLLAGRMRRFSR